MLQKHPDLASQQQCAGSLRRLGLAGPARSAWQYHSSGSLQVANDAATLTACPNIQESGQQRQPAVAALYLNDWLSTNSRKDREAQEPQVTHSNIPTSLHPHICRRLRLKYMRVCEREGAPPPPSSFPDQTIASTVMSSDGGLSDQSSKLEARGGFSDAVPEGTGATNRSTAASPASFPCCQARRPNWSNAAAVHGSVLRA
jgi:hypothetical protein